MSIRFSESDDKIDECRPEQEDGFLFWSDSNFWDDVAQALDLLVELNPRNAHSMYMTRYPFLALQTGNTFDATRFQM